VGVRVWINGFGRIGMLVARAAMQTSDVEIACELEVYGERDSDD